MKHTRGAETFRVHLTASSSLPHLSMPFDTSRHPRFPTGRCCAEPVLMLAQRSAPSETLGFKMSLGKKKQTVGAVSRKWVHSGQEGAVPNYGYIYIYTHTHIHIYICKYKCVYVYTYATCTHHTCRFSLRPATYFDMAGGSDDVVEARGSRGLCSANGCGRAALEVSGAWSAELPRALDIDNIYIYTYIYTNRYRKIWIWIYI